MHMFLSVLGWVLLLLLCLVVLLLILPVFLLVEYKGAAYKEEPLTVKVRILFLTFTLLPQKEKPQKPKKAKKKETPKEPKTQEPPKKAPKPFTLDTVLELVSMAGGAMRMVLRGLWFTGIRIVFPVHRETPADTAVAYGQTQAYFGGAVATLRNFLNLRFKSVRIIADFENENADRTYFYCKIGATPAIMVAAGIYALVRLKRENIL